MNKKEVFIIDKLVTGYNHVVFNAAFSAIIATIYKNHSVIFVAESLHTNVIAIKNKFLANLKYQPYIEPTLPNGKLNKLMPWIKKKLDDLLFIREIYKNKIEDSDGTFFTCLSTTALLYAGYKAKHTKKPIYFFLHGEIEYLFISDVNFVNKMRGRIYKIFLSQLGTTSKVIVLSEIVKNKLIEGHYLPSDKIITIEHPIIPTNYETKPLSSGKVILGHIGIAVKKKNSPFFFELARLNAIAIENNEVEFVLIGKIEYGLKLINTSYVKILSKNNESLTQDDYEQNIINIDYAVFTFDEENYVYRASGSIIDAITFSKPIIALKHTYFNYLFETAGNIGFLCDNKEELNLLLTRIIKKEKVLLNQYQTQQRNLIQLMHKLSIDKIKDKLLSAVMPISK